MSAGVVKSTAVRSRSAADAAGATTTAVSRTRAINRVIGSGLLDGSHHALRGARDEAGVAAQDDEAVAAADHHAGLLGRERDATERHVAAGEDRRLRLRDDVAQAWMVELAG